MIRRNPSTRKDSAAAVSGVDQRIRECVQLLWLALPSNEANLESLEPLFRRSVDRAIKDFKEDTGFLQKEDGLFSSLKFDQLLPLACIRLELPSAAIKAFMRMVDG